MSVLGVQSPNSEMSAWGGIGDFLNNGLDAWVQTEVARHQYSGSAQAQEDTRNTTQQDYATPAAHSSDQAASQYRSRAPGMTTGQMVAAGALLVGVFLLIR